MSLVDGDKEKGDRANPVLNTEDNVKNRMAHKTIGTTYKTAGTADSNRLIFDKGSVKGIDSNDNNNLFFGYDPAVANMPVLKIAADGFDATTAANENISFDSSRNLFEIVASGSITIPALTLTSGVSQYAAQTGTTVTIPHGLSFIPAVMGIVSSSYGPVPTPVIINGAVSTGAFSQFNFIVSADATNIKAFQVGFGFNISGGSTSPAANATYFLLRQVAPN